ncbi:disease resistance protein RPV1-like [Solanum lycopersicum]|uniref:disease resistance protein RPV1-like n=1 Tax=Solanum lycopersicum TaxID=4081 RepID=UPI00374A7437
MKGLRVEEASNVKSRCMYDVFMSFRGEDTRKTFTDELYKALVDEGYRTFRDDNEIERGEDIKSELDKAIHSSKSSIIILSKNYATSSWCLDELVMILENKRKRGHAILPVFYYVDPLDVGKQMGSFATAFATHEQRIMEQSDDEGKEEKIKRWRAALREVADQSGSGMVLQSSSKETELRFIEKLVKVTENKVNRSILSVAPYLIGMHFRVNNICLWLQHKTHDVGIWGICGMGGIGKTTIAKYAFNSNFESFERSSFLYNVRDFSESTDGLIYLQKQFLCDILDGRKIDIQSVEDGMNQIKSAVYGKRVLIVLDDVDEVEQLAAIVGMRDWFYSGSKIIVTTRHIELLRACEIELIDHVQKLSLGESVELFSWHAFGQDHPVENYTKFLTRIIEYCIGCPLALQVLGSSLSGKSLDVWESTLKKLEAIPNSKVSKKLQISFEFIQDDHDKSLFLDIASFFLGKNVDHVVTILNACGYYTMVGLQNLRDRFLLIIDEYGKLRMHPLVRDMGREIIRQESPKHPERRSRLWHFKDSFNVLREKIGTDMIRGLNVRSCAHKDKPPRFFYHPTAHEYLQECAYLMGKKKLSSQSNPSRQPQPRKVLTNGSLGKSKKVDSVNTDAFSGMHKLKLLQLDNLALKGSYKEFPRSLRWLCWHKFPYKCLPDGLPLEKLVVLEMRYSRLHHLFERNKVLSALKILNLSHSEGLSYTPDFSKLPNLERIILKYCTRLTLIDKSIGGLKRLLILNLKCCQSLRKLPRCITNVHSLEKLILYGCSKFEWSSLELNKMQSLLELDAGGTAIHQDSTCVRKKHLLSLALCTLVSSPRKSPGIVNLLTTVSQTLVTLSLIGCGLSSDLIPVELGDFSTLQNLYLSKNPIDSLPDSIKKLTNLQVLELEKCQELKYLPEIPASVTTLSIYGCRSIERLSNLPNILTTLEFLVLSCNKLIEVQEMFQLKCISLFDADLISVLGLPNLSDMKVDLYNNLTLTRWKCPIQGLYEFGIFSTSFHGSELPDWLSYKSTGSSSISFDVPNHDIQGLNLYVIYGKANISYCTKRNKFWNEFHVRVVNKTKDLRWTYSPIIHGIPDNYEDITWLCNWEIGDHLDPGDSMSISMTLYSGVRLKQLGVHIVYKNNLRCNTSPSPHPHNLINGVDNSAYQVQGSYLLCHHDFDIQQNYFTYGWNSTGWYDFFFGDNSEDFPEEMVPRHNADMTGENVYGLLSGV